MVNSGTAFNLDDKAEKKSLFNVRKRFGVNSELTFWMWYPHSKEVEGLPCRINLC